MTTLYFPSTHVVFMFPCLFDQISCTEDISISDRLSFGKSQQFNAFIDPDLVESGN